MVNLHHLPQTVKRVLQGEDLDLRFSYEEEILGTAGCFRKVRDFLGDSTFVVSNGKIYFEGDLGRIIDQHQATKALVSMVLVPFDASEPYNPVYMTPDGRIVGFARGFGEGSLGAYPEYELYTYTGVQVIEPEVLQWIPPGVSDSVNDIYPRLMELEGSLHGVVSDHYWCEASTPARYLQKSLEVLNRQGWDSLCAPEIQDQCKGAVIGEGVTVPKTTTIENSILWGGTELGNDSSFYNVIITDGVSRLPGGTHLRDVVVTPVQDSPEESDAALGVVGSYTLWPLI
jgi:mannose-1-phosphate guanylyltransferase/mannose-1-phosphate guanylyltransferase/phosphomannomutase